MMRTFIALIFCSYMYCCVSSWASVIKCFE
nr:MAG TPA: hypothetical protein [Caudoviricetes sp.]